MYQFKSYDKQKLTTKKRYIQHPMFNASKLFKNQTKKIRLINIIN